MKGIVGKVARTCLAPVLIILALAANLAAAYPAVSTGALMAAALPSCTSDAGLASCDRTGHSHDTEDHHGDAQGDHTHEQLTVTSHSKPPAGSARHIWQASRQNSAIPGRTMRLERPPRA